MGKVKNVFKYLGVLFAFVMGFLFINVSQTKAVNLYIDTSNGIGDGYDSNGYINKFKNEIVIYAVDFDKGLVFSGKSDKERGYRFTNFEIVLRNGESSGNIKANIVAETQFQPGSQKTPSEDDPIFTNYGLTYAIASKYTVDKITIKNINSFFTSSKISDNRYNNVDIKISLEWKEIGLLWSSWHKLSESDINFIDSNGNKTNSGVLYKSTEKSLNKTTIDSINNSNNFYFKTDSNMNKEYNQIYFSKYNSQLDQINYSLDLYLPFFTQSGEVKIKYVDSNNNEYFTNSISKSYRNINLYRFRTSDFNDIFNKEGYEVYDMVSISYNLTDEYGVNIASEDYTISLPKKNCRLYIVNEQPKMNQIELKSPTLNKVGQIQINATFDFTNLDLDYNSYIFTLNNVFFNVGKSVVAVDSIDKNGDTFNFSDLQDFHITKTYYISSNQGVGAITLNYIVATLKDKYGNVTTYGTENSKNIKVQINGDLELKSNSSGTYLDSKKYYLYDQEDFNYKVVLNSAINTSVESIYLSNSSSDDNLLIYNSLDWPLDKQIIKHTDAKTEEFEFTIKIDDKAIKTFDEIKLVNFCIKKGDGSKECEKEVVLKDRKYFLNYYQSISVVEENLTNKDLFNITGMNDFKMMVNIDLNKIEVTNNNIGTDIKINSCNNNQTSIECNYYNNNSEDGISKITLNPGTFSLDNGLKNKKYEFHVITNNNNPSISITNNDEFIDNNGKYFYKNDKNIMLSINDTYCNSGVLTYYFEMANSNSKEVTLEFTCSNNISSGSVLEIPLPNTDGNYILHYKIESDGLNGVDVKCDHPYVARNSIDLQGVNVMINNDLQFLVDNQKHFNYISVAIEGISDNNLLDSYKLKIGNDKVFSEYSINNIAKFNTKNRKDFENKNIVEVNLILQIVDKLENSKEYTYKVILDTVTPENPTYKIVSSDSGIYKIEITNYSHYDDGDEVILSYIKDGKQVSNKCSKGSDKECNFTISNDVFYLESKDMANNSSERMPYSSVPTHGYISNNILSIRPFVSDIYDPSRDVVIKVYKTSYTKENIDITKINRSCSSAITNDCYYNYKLGQHDYSLEGEGNNQLNIKMSLFSLKSNHSYIFFINLGKNSEGLVDESNKLPRLDIELEDTLGPSLDSTSIGNNPKVVSDNKNNSNEFIFNFKVTDKNLTNKEKFEYVIINSRVVGNDYSINDREFDSYLNECPKNLSKNEDICGQWSNGFIDYESLNNNIAIGKIIINKDLRMANNTIYDIFIRVSDSLGNSSIHLLNEFLNVSESFNVTYNDGNNASKEVIDSIIKTYSEDATININLIKGLKDESIKIESILVDNELRNSNSFHLTGNRKVIITDSIGNSVTINTYIGSLSRPIIEIYSEVDGKFFKISSNNEYAYNASTLNSLYILVSGSNLESIVVSNKSYQSGDPIFDKMTNISTHGINMSELGIESDNGVVIEAHSESGNTRINLRIDSIAPDIIIADGIKDNIEVIYLNNKYTIKFNGDNSYSFATIINYDSQLTYETFFKGMNLKIDGYNFDQICDSLRLKVTKDGLPLTDFNEPLTSLESSSIISINYFDAAGNVAIPFNISYTVKDKQAPTMSSKFTPTRVVESNREVNVILDDVSIFDNFDSLEDIDVTIRIDKEEIYNGKANKVNTIKYIFKDNKDYTLTIILKDRAGNISSDISQVITSKDTIGPVVDESSKVEINEIEVNKDVVISLPKFIDTDKDSSEYYPSIIEVYKEGKLVEESNYSIKFDTINNTITIRFNNYNRLGDYTITFVCKDKFNNISTSDMNFKLVDKKPPKIIIYNNDNIIIDESINVEFSNFDAFNLSYEGKDEYEGRLKVNKTGSVDIAKAGSYILTFTCTDSSNNTTIRTLTVVVIDDKVPPVINKVNFGDFVLAPTLNKENPVINSINNSYDFLTVSASDNVSVNKYEVSVNGTSYNINDKIILANNTLESPYSIIVIKVTDSANNSTSSTYYLKVDSKAPIIDGIENKGIYIDKVNISVTDNNLSSVQIYKDKDLIKDYNLNKELIYTIDLIGLYRIVAKDEFGNISEYVFELVKDKSFTIDSNKQNFDNVYLAKVNFENVDEKIEVILDYDYQVKDNDEVYIIAKSIIDGNSHIVYRCNGTYFNGHEKIELTGKLVNNLNNIDFIEKIGDEYYMYIGVIQGEEETLIAPKKDNTILINTLIIISSILAFIVIAFLIIKFRRKVKAA